MNRLIPDEVILGLLKAQPAHGYELLEIFRSSSQLGRIWTMSTSQLYAVLKRLERDGAITGDEIVATNAPPRVEYKITPHGEAQLTVWLYESDPSPSIHRMRVLFLSRIFIANLLNTSYREIVNAQILACEKQITLFNGWLHQKLSSIEQLTIGFVIEQLESAIRWLKKSNFDLVND